jgi:hypothetical protein
MSDPTAQPQAQSSTPPAEPAPGSAEHRNAMIAAYDAQFAAQGAQPKPQDPPKDPADPQDPPKDPKDPVEPPKDPADPNPQDPPKDPADTAKDPKDPVEPEAPKETPKVADLLKAEGFYEKFTSAELADDVKEQLKSAGLEGPEVEALRQRLITGDAAVAQLHVQKLQGFAGGKANYDALIAWGKANLTAEQKASYDTQLSGADAEITMGLLMAKMRASNGPVVAGGGGAAPGKAGFRSQAEVTEAMSDKRYWSDPAYHNDVKARLALSKF